MRVVVVAFLFVDVGLCVVVGYVHDDDAGCRSLIIVVRESARINSRNISVRT